MDTPQSIPYNAEGPINPYSVIKAGASGGALQGAANTDKLLGIATEIASALGEVVDVQVDGIVPGKAGGTVAQGDLLTSDANGNLITLAGLTAATNYRMVAVAMEAAVSGDVFRVKVQLGSIQG